MNHPPEQLRIGLVEDHQAVALGLGELIRRQQGWSLDVIARTVDGLLATGAELDVVLLDLRLDDGNRVADNVESLRAASIPVIAYTAGEDVELLREAGRSGVMAIVRKSDDVDVLLEAVRSVAGGVPYGGTDWAAAIDGASDLADARLSPREREVLALYASGETAAGVAELTGLSRDTVANYVSRIRTKYALAGRHATTKVELHLRAREDGLVQPRNAQRTVGR